MMAVIRHEAQNRVGTGWDYAITPSPFHDVRILERSFGWCRIYPVSTRSVTVFAWFPFERERHHHQRSHSPTGITPRNNIVTTTTLVKEYILQCISILLIPGAV